MHILVIPSWFETPKITTLGSFFKDQAIALTERNHQVGIIYAQATSIKKFTHWYKKRYYTCNNQKVNIINTAYFTWPLMRKLNRLKRFEHFEKLFLEYSKKNGKPDIIHAHSVVSAAGGGAGLIANYLKDKYQIPYILTEHSSELHFNNYPEMEKSLMITALIQAHSVIAVSNALANDLRKLIPSKKIAIIGNIIDTKFFYPQETFNNTYHFVVIGYLRPIKRVDILIQAFAETLKTHNNIHLTIIGDGLEKSNLEALTHTLKIENKVTFTGELSRIKTSKILNESDCYLSASKYETFGVAIHEALSAGLHVISSNSQGPEEIIKELNEVIVAENDVYHFAQAMANKIKMNKPTMAEKNLKNNRIKELYSTEAIALLLEEQLTYPLSITKTNNV